MLNMMAFRTANQKLIFEIDYRKYSSLWISTQDNFFVAKDFTGGRFFEGSLRPISGGSSKRARPCRIQRRQTSWAIGSSMCSSSSMVIVSIRAPLLEIF